MIDVLIINDNRYREQFSTELLLNYLNSNLIVRVVSKNIFRTAIQLLKPKAVVVPRVQTDFKDIFDFKERYNFKLFFIPVEHSGGNESGVLSFMRTFLKKNEIDKKHSEKLKLHISKVFVPGKFYKNVLLKNDLFEENQIVVTGTPSSDLWFKSINSIFKNKKKGEKTIGIATSFKSFIFGSSFNSVQQSIKVISDFQKNRIQEGSNKNQIDIQSQEKDLFFSWYEMYQFIIINKIIKDNKNLNFSIRVHPMENVKNVRYYQKNIPNLTIDRNLILNEWISEQKIILSFSSTLLYDSYFAGIKSYSLRKLLPNNIINLIDDHLKPAYSEFPFQPENYEDLYKIINLGETNNENYFTQEVENKIKETSLPAFNFPRNEKAYKIIGKEIKNNIDLKQISFFDKIVTHFFSLIILLKQIKLANFLFKLNYVNFDKLYNPLNFFQNRRLRKYIRKIIKN